MTMVMGTEIYVYFQMNLQRKRPAMEQRAESASYGDLLPARGGG
jgi:hypothetical protein